METFVTIVVTLTGLLMLIVPLWVLEFLSKPVAQLGAICGFISLFLAFVSCVTVARPFESLAATAAYVILFLFLKTRELMNIIT